MWLRHLTRLVGKFSKSKVSPKKKFARIGGHLCCGEFNAFMFPCQDIIDLMCESRSDNNNAGECHEIFGPGRTKITAFLVRLCSDRVSFSWSHV